MGDRWIDRRGCRFWLKRRAGFTFLQVDLTRPRIQVDARTIGSAALCALLLFARFKDASENES